jgi:hypothetical protein
MFFPRSRTVRAAVATLTGALAIAAGASSALAAGTTVACSTRTQSTPFTTWGDTNSYFQVPNGGFESTTNDWALTGGASIVTGNETWKVAGSTNSKSLRIPNGASAESHTICVGRGEDSIRLFVNNAKVAGSILHVEAIVRNPSTGQIAQTAFDVNGDAAPKGWGPTMRLQIPDLLGTQAGSQQELTLRFTTRGSAATWAIDDVYVDPLKLK